MRKISLFLMAAFLLFSNPVMADGKLTVLADSNGTSTYVSAPNIWPALLKDGLGFDTLSNRSVAGLYSGGGPLYLSNMIADDADLYVINLGTNDQANAIANNGTQSATLATIKTEIETTVQGLVAQNKRVVVMSPAMSLNPKVNVRLSQTSELLRDLCYKDGCQFVDLFGYMQWSSFTMSTADFIAWFYNQPSADQYHLSTIGHARVADFVLKSLNGTVVGEDEETPPPGSATVSYNGSAVSATDGLSFSFPAQPIGAATATRRVIVGITGGDASTGDVTAVTVGGVSATEIYDFRPDGRLTAFYIAAVPTGTTATVAVTFNTAQGHAGISTWSADGLESDTPVDFELIAYLGTGHAFPSLTTSDGGFAVAMMHGKSALSTWTWANMTERSDMTVEGVASQSSADVYTTGAALSAIATSSSGSTLSNGIVMSFR